MPLTKHVQPVSLYDARFVASCGSVCYIVTCRGVCMTKITRSSSDDLIY
jgi:hypothetical protein